MTLFTLNSAGLSPDGKWFSDRWGKDVFWNTAVDRVLIDLQTRYQHIQVFETRPLGRMLVLDDNIQCAEGDEAGYHELLVHTGLCRAEAPRHDGRRVLVIGGGDGGAAREALRHADVSRVDLVDIDEGVVAVAREHLPSIWRHPGGGSLDRDPRLRVLHEDGVLFLENGGDDYDLVVVDASDCIGPGAALYSRRFYEAIRRRLRPGGAVTVQAGSFWYLPEALATVHHGLRQVFPRVDVYQCFTAVYPGGIWNLAVATLGDDPTEPDDEAIEKLAGLEWYGADVHRAAFVLPPIARSILKRMAERAPEELAEVLRELMA